MPNWSLWRQGLACHFALLTFDKIYKMHFGSDLVGTDGLNASPGCFVTDVAARSWIRNAGEVSNPRKILSMGKQH